MKTRWISLFPATIAAIFSVACSAATALEEPLSLEEVLTESACPVMAEGCPYSGTKEHSALLGKEAKRGSEGATCPVTGATGASSLSLEEVMDRMHEEGAMLPPSEPICHRCPHGKEANPQHPQGTWL